MAQRYSDWARQQVDRANRTLNPKARNDRLALAEYYWQLAEVELAAAKRLEPLMVVLTELDPTKTERAQRVAGLVDPAIHCAPSTIAEFKGPAE